MPLLVDPALPTGTLRDRVQPRIDVDDRLVLRPWRAADASAVRAAVELGAAGTTPTCTRACAPTGEPRRPVNRGGRSGVDPA